MYYQDTHFQWDNCCDFIFPWPGQPLRLVRPWPDIKSGYRTVGACVRENRFSNSTCYFSRLLKTLGCHLPSKAHGHPREGACVMCIYMACFSEIDFSPLLQALAAFMVLSWFTISLGFRPFPHIRKKKGGVYNGSWPFHVYIPPPFFAHVWKGSGAET